VAKKSKAGVKLNWLRHKHGADATLFDGILLLCVTKWTYAATGKLSHWTASASGVEQLPIINNAKTEEEAMAAVEAWCQSHVDRLVRGGSRG